MAKSTTSKREPKRQDDFDQENDSQDDDIFGTAISTVKSKQVKKQKVEVKQVKRFKDTAKKPAKPKQSVQEVKKVVEEEEEEVPLAVKKTRKVSEKPASEDKVTVKSPVFSAPSAFLSPRKSLGGQDTQDLSLKIEMMSKEITSLKSRVRLSDMQSSSDLYTTYKASSMIKFDEYEKKIALLTVQVETLKSKCDSETDYKNTINKLESEIDSANNATQSIQAKFDSLSETVEPIKKELKVKDQLISELTKSLSECRLELANMSGFSELKYIADFYENSTGMKVIFQGTSEMQSFKVFNQNVSRTKSFEYTLSKDEQGWYYSPGLGQDFTGMPEYLMEEIQFPDLDAFFGKVYSSMGI